MSRTAAFAALVACLFSAGICMADPARKAGVTGPIKVGSISSLALFPEAAAAVQAYFDTINAGGGVQGRELQLIVADDKAQPQTAAQAARNLVDRQGVVAHVGSASALECAVNAGFYAERRIVSIQGTGVDPGCFDSSHIAPVNTGPYASVAVALKFLSEVRKRSHVCAVTVAYAPSQKPAFEKVMTDWVGKSGKPLRYAAMGISPSEDLGIHIKKATENQCEGLVFTAIEPAVIDLVTKAKALKVGGIDWVFLTPAYTQNVADTLKAEGEGIFAMSEFEPWSSRSGMLTDWRNIMRKSNVPLTSLSQGGYVAASVFVTTLRGIEGDITRESVTRAFESMTPRKVSLMGTPFSFGKAPRHNPNRAAIPVRLEGGKWRVAHWDYITLD